MRKTAVVVAVVALAVAGCSWPGAPVEPPLPELRASEDSPAIVIEYFASQPERDPQDTNLVGDAGPAAVAIVGALTARDPLFAVLGYFAGQVALRTVERGSDLNVVTERIVIPTDGGQVVVLDRARDGTLHALIGPRPGDAPTAVPIVPSWLAPFDAADVPQPEGIGPE